MGTRLGGDWLPVFPRSSAWRAGCAAGPAGRAVVGCGRGGDLLPRVMRCLVSESY